MSRLATSVVLFLIASFVTAVVLRALAAGRRRALAHKATKLGWTWAALCRVVSGGNLLGGSAGNRLTARGTLLELGGQLVWMPDSGDARRGYAQKVWPLDEVRVTNVQAGRDITGIAFTQVAMTTPEGQVEFALFGETGRRPAILAN